MKFLLILIIIFFSSCSVKKTTTSVNTGVSEFYNANNHLIVETTCQENSIKINDYSSLRITPNVCSCFEEYLNQNHKVILVLRGFLDNEQFHVDNGRYYILKGKDFDNQWEIIEERNFDLVDFGFIIDQKEYEKSIQYKLSVLNYDVIKDDSNININQNPFVLYLFIN